MSDNASSSNFDCFRSNSAISILNAFLVTKMIVIFPLSIIILYLGYQQWQRQQCSFAATNHSDIFIYHVTAIELIFVLGTIILIYGQYTNNLVALFIGSYSATIAYPGEIFFNIVTCVERYLAVVHPITYLELKKSGGVRIRNICTGCVWLLSFGWLGVAAVFNNNVPYIPYFCMIAVSLVTVSYCSLSVLCVLIRPGPGEMGGGRQQVNQAKQKAFRTITAIMVVLLVSFLGVLITIAMNTSNLLSKIDRCAIIMSGSWFTLPTTLVLPLLFLHRAGKRSFCLLSNK